ncbi:hypothetical protein QQ020_08635 [Fulvivirgaceae bacterium BMA12]|uniref:Sensor of ECF-type sigma factor n=1 Tax=Agaribacillus aureus TaxID=3051825 RepID=A0ABT8L320_9BACT|nr:hypothetical protein [Fulvivirgaceae bacterium BMA12]
MERIIFITILILANSYFACGQKGKAREKIEAARIALITNELNLSPEQAQKFWPIYNEFKSKRGEIARNFNLEKKNFDAATATEEERKKMVNRGLELKQRQLNLEKEYSQKLLDVISSRQIIQLRQAEDKFRRLLIERLQQNREQRLRRRQSDEVQKRRDEWQRRKNDN